MLVQILSLCECEVEVAASLLEEGAIGSISAARTDDLLYCT